MLVKRALTTTTTTTRNVATKSDFPTLWRIFVKRAWTDGKMKKTRGGNKDFLHKTLFKAKSHCFRHFFTSLPTIQKYVCVRIWHIRTQIYIRMAGLEKTGKEVTFSFAIECTRLNAKLKTILEWIYFKSHAFRYINKLANLKSSGPSTRRGRLHWVSFHVCTLLQSIWLLCTREINFLNISFSRNVLLSFVPCSLKVCI